MVAGLWNSKWSWCGFKYENRGSTGLQRLDDIGHIKGTKKMYLLCGYMPLLPSSFETYRDCHR